MVVPTITPMMTQSVAQVMPMPSAPRSHRLKLVIARRVESEEWRVASGEWRVCSHSPLPTPHSQSELPEGTRKPRSREDLVRLGDRAPAPGRRQAIGEPVLRECPALADGEDLATRNAGGSDRTLDVLFRPEESHRASGEDDVRPPPRCR